MAKTNKLKHAKYNELASLLKNYDKPILILGDVGCGKTTAVMQLAEETNSKLYFLGSVETSKDFIGIDNEKEKDVPSSFFLSYVNGGILYVDDVAKRKVDIIMELLTLVKKESLTVGKKKYPKNKDFKVILSCENQNELITNYVKKTIVDRKLVNMVEFEYDEILEKKICSDKEFYKFFLGVRSFNKDSMFMGATTTALTKCSKLLETNVFTQEDIIQALLVKGYTVDTLKELYKHCYPIGEDNPYLVALKNLIILNSK